MSGSKVATGDRGANAADCARLWSTLTSEMIADAQMVIIPEVDQNGDSLIAIEVITPCLHQVNGEEQVYVFSRREFRNQLHLISVGQLFDLLITAYRVADRFFEHGDAAAPPRRKR